MIKNKKSLSIALSLFIIAMVLNFPFPHAHPFGESMLSLISFPVKSTGGWHYVGIISFILFMASLYFLSKSLKKYRTRIILFVFFFSGTLPSFIVSTYQKTLATDIYAVSYESSNCDYEMTDATTLFGECELSLNNFNSNDVRFTIEFYDPYQPEGEDSFVTLMNNHAPFEITLEGNESKQ